MKIRVLGTVKFPKKNKFKCIYDRGDYSSDNMITHGLNPAEFWGSDMGCYDVLTANIGGIVDVIFDAFRNIECVTVE